MYSALIKAIADMFSKFFELKAVQTENLSTTEIIEDKKDYKKATNIAEKIIAITNKYKKQMTFADRMRFAHLCESFYKHN
ncbi:MAG: hypothetical protein KHX03_06240 [Clostridium sp.]|nr:hypothetical protein [Clostridium sp.]